MISDKLQSIIQIKEKRQTDIAKYLDISASRLSNYISGKREPDYKLIVQMAKYFDVDMNYFSDEIFNNYFVSDNDTNNTNFISEYNDSLSNKDISLMVASKLQQVIQKKEIKQADIAKYFNISPSRLSNYISGKRDIKYHMLGRIAKYLGVDMNYFFEELFSPYSTDDIDRKIFFISEDKDNNGIIHIPFLNTFSKKNEIPYTSVPFAKSFLPNITDREKENMLAINLDDDKSLDRVLENIIIICVHIDYTDLVTGNKIIEKGQSNRFFNYFEEGGIKLLVDHKFPKNNIRIDNNSDMSCFYKVLCQFEKFH